MGLQDFGQHAFDTGLPVRQGQAEGGLQLGRVQARVVRAHGGVGKALVGTGATSFATILIADCALLACSITNFA